MHTYIFVFMKKHIVLCSTGICNEQSLEYKLHGKTFSLFPETKTYTMRSLYICGIKNHFPPKITCKALTALE